MKNKKILKIFIPVLLAVILLFNLTACSQDRFMRRSEYLSGLPANGIIPGSITLRVNSFGNYTEEFTLDFELNYYAAPITVTNFVYLVQTGFYDYSKFSENADKDYADMVMPIIHRLEQRTDFFILQGGGYKTSADNPDTEIVELVTGGLGYGIKGEFSNNGWENNTITFTEGGGVIAMARQTGYDTAASEFFITFGSVDSSYDGDYAAFGTIGQISSKLLNVLKDMPVTSKSFGFSSTYFNNYPSYKIEIIGLSIDPSVRTFPQSLQIVK